MGTEVTQVLQGRLRTNDGPTVFWIRFCVRASVYQRQQPCPSRMRCRLWENAERKGSSHFGAWERLYIPYIGSLFFTSRNVLRSGWVGLCTKLKSQGCRWLAANFETPSTWESGRHVRGCLPFWCREVMWWRGREARTSSLRWLYHSVILLTALQLKNGLTYEQRLQALKLQPLGKRRLRNDLVLTHKILYNDIDMDATQLFKFSRRPGLRRSSIRLLHQTGRTRRRWNSFACRVVNNWNRLPFAVASVTAQSKFKQLLDSYIYS